MKYSSGQVFDICWSDFFSDAAAVEKLCFRITSQTILPSTRNLQYLKSQHYLTIMPIRQFGSEISLTSLLNTFEDEAELTKRRTADKEQQTGVHCSLPSSCSTIKTESVTSFNRSCDLSEALPTSIVKLPANLPGVQTEESLQEWINQPIPDFPPSTTPSRRQRRSGSTDSAPEKYDGVKTRFPSRKQGRRERPARKTRKQRPPKTVEEQWVKTCRFLWWKGINRVHYDSVFFNCLTVGVIPLPAWTIV